MRFTDAFDKLNRYGVSKETMGTVVEQNKCEAEKLLHNTSKLSNLLQKAQLLCEHFRKATLGGEIFIRIPVLCSIVRDYVNGSYTGFPIKSIIMIVIGLIYFVNPCDIIADYIPMLGTMDDSFILSQILSTLEIDIQRYEEQYL